MQLANIPLPKNWTVLQPELLQQWDTIITGLRKNDRIAVIHDADPDGVCAAVVINKILEKIRGRGIDLRLNRKGGRHHIAPEMLTQLKKKKISHIITTDLPVEENLQTLLGAAKMANVIILDHHKLCNNVNSKKVLLLKPQLLWKEPNPAYYATAKLIFDLGSRLCDLSEIEWIAGAGLIGDSGFMQWGEYLHNLLRRLKITPKKNWFDTSIGKVPATISLALCYNKKFVARCYETLKKAKDWNSFCNSPLKKYSSAVEQEIRKHVQKFSRVKPVEEIYLYELQPKYHITGTLSTILGHKHPNKTVIIADISDKTVFVSARRNDSKVAVNDLLSQSVKGIAGAQGGGHIPAAGASVPKERYAQFKQNLFKISHSIIKQRVV